MVHSRTILGFFVFLAGVSVVDGQVPNHVPTAEERARMNMRRPSETFNPPTPAAPTPAPTPFTPVPPTPVPPTPGNISPGGQQQQMQQQTMPAQTGAALPPLSGPVVPPVVTFRDGLLTVQALHSTLGSVMTAIRNKTGIEFEGGEGAMDMVAISLGPAPEGEVLAAIFSGSGFDFLAMGRPDSPNIVQRVILKPNNKIGPMAAGNASPTIQTPRTPQNGDEEENVPEEQVVEQPQDTPMQPPPTAVVQPRLPEQFQQQLQQRQQQQQDQDNLPHAPRKQPPL